MEIEDNFSCKIGLVNTAGFKRDIPRTISKEKKFKLYKLLHFV
jgi:hypothetical protein